MPHSIRLLQPDPQAPTGLDLAACGSTCSKGKDNDRGSFCKFLEKSRQTRPDVKKLQHYLYISHKPSRIRGLRGKVGKSLEEVGASLDLLILVATPEKFEE
jgi:hypothetical protein